MCLSWKKKKTRALSDLALGAIREGRIGYFNHPDLHEEMKKAAIARSKDYTADQILQKLLQDTGMTL